MTNIVRAVVSEGSPFHSDTLTDEEWNVLAPEERGYLLGLWAYAWWQNGMPMVGTTGTTFRTAVDRVLREWGYPR